MYLYHATHLTVVMTWEIIQRHQGWYPNYCELVVHVRSWHHGKSTWQRTSLRTPNQLLLLCDLCDWQCQDHLPAIPAVWTVSRFVISAQHIKTWRCNISLKWVITGSGNGLVLVQRQTTTQANNDLVSVRPSRTYLCGTRVRWPAWWHHRMETFSALLALCAGNSSVSGALIFSLIWAWTNGWATNRNVSDLRWHRAHYDVSVMWKFMWKFRLHNIGHFV